MPYRLTFAAESDLDAIYLDGFIRFGERAADTYSDRIVRALNLIGFQPRMARERQELRNSVRAHPVGSHIVLYRVEGESAVILRIRHGREDWLSDDEGA